MTTETEPRPLVIVSKSEPDEQVAKLGALRLNAVDGEAGTDYVWYPHSQIWGIERKTVSNLLQSLADRQLVEQTHKGSEKFDRYIILIEGEYSRGSNGKLVYFSPRDPRADGRGYVESGWEYAAVNGMLFALQMIGNNVMVHHWPVLFDSATAIASIVHATSTPDAGKFVRERQRPDLPVEAAFGGKLYEDTIWSLCALPGCGPEIAMALLEKYGTLEHTIQSVASGQGADVKVKGRSIGPKRIAKIREAITKTFR